MITLRRIMEYFPENGIHTLNLKRPDAMFGGTVILIERTQLSLKNQIHFVEESAFIDLLKPEDIPPDITLIFGFNSEESMRGQTGLVERLGQMENCFILTDHALMHRLYMDVCNLFDVHAKMHTALMQVSGMIARDAGLQPITDAIADAFGTTTAVIDNVYAVLSVSMNYPTKYSHETLSAEKGMLEPGILSMLKNQNYMHRLNTSRDVVCIKNPLEDDPVYAIAIYSGKMKLGFLSIYDHELKLKPEHLHYMPDFANLLAIWLGKSGNVAQDKNFNLSYLFYYLLHHDNSLDFPAVRSRFMMFGYHLMPNMHLLCMDASYSSIPPANMHAAAEQLRRLFKNSCYALQDTRILFLISRTDENPITEQELSVWEEKLSAAGYFVGMSEEFHDFTHFSMQYRQAMAACRIGFARESPLYLSRFDSLRMDFMAERLKEKEEDAELCCYPPLLKLMRYDEENHMHLTETLYLYLSHPKQIDQICEKLYIHKNTLFYRMNKIRGIMGSDLYDGEEITQIMLTFKLLGYTFG